MMIAKKGGKRESRCEKLSFVQMTKYTPKIYWQNFCSLVRQNDGTTPLQKEANTEFCIREKCIVCKENTLILEKC